VPVSRLHLAFLLTTLVALAVSAYHPSSYGNWISETFPAILGGALLVFTYRNFRFTTVTYTFAWLFALILITGGHYTYANVPIGNWARDTFHQSRNHFDRVGHFLQGVVPALFARELLLRTTPLPRGKWLFTICVCIALAISAAYELFEWQYAVHFGGQAAADFLGSQGDIWDAQKDMAMALCGAIAALALLSRVQDRQLPNAEGASSRPEHTEAAPTSPSAEG
jgi:putative membrane protein